MVELMRITGMNVDEARELHVRLTPLFRALFLETNPQPVKTALALQGLIEPEFRLPLVPVKPETERALVAALEAAGEPVPASPAR